MGNINVENIEKPANLQYNLDITDGMIKKDFLLALLPSNSIPASIQLPDVITLKGKLKGDMNNIDPDFVAGGSDGIIAVKGFVHNFKNINAAAYDIQLKTDNLEAGKLLKQDSLLGNITLIASAKGNGMNYKTMQSLIHLHVDNAEIKQYTYHNLDINADFEKGVIKLEGSIADPAVQLQYKISTDVSGAYPSMLDASLELDTLQLKKLNLYGNTLNASFHASLKSKTLDPKNIDLYALIDSIHIDLKNKKYQLDSVMTSIVSDNGQHIASFRSPIADIDANGIFSYDKITTSITQFINKYYPVTNSESTENVPAQKIAFHGTIKDHPLITGLVNGLKYDNINFNGSYSSDGGDSALNMNIAIPSFSYPNYHVGNGKINVTSFNDHIGYGVSFSSFRFNNNIFYSTDIKGNIEKDSITVYALTKDDRNKNRFGIGASIGVKDKQYSVSLNDKLLINYQSWNVSNDNQIDYSEKGIIIKDFVLENKKAVISLKSQQNSWNSPIGISIQNFDIKDIASILNTDTLLASGMVNTQLEVSGLEKKLPSFTGNVAINDFSFMQQPVGNIDFSAQTKDENSVSAGLKLSGNGNAVNVNGTYFLNDDQNQFNANINIDTLKMATVQAFTAGNMSRASGSVHGNATINGSFTQPKWNGEIDFDSSKFTVAKTGATYSITHQKIDLGYPDISFDSLEIKDSSGNILTIDGNITAQSLTTYGLDIDIDTKNFIVVNTPAAIDNQVYGFATADIDLSIEGTTTSPDIEGDIALNKKSDVTIILPEQNVDRDAAKSVVRFIDRDTFALPEKILFSPEGDSASNAAQFLNYNLTVKISRQSTLTIDVDPASGDQLKVQGEAELNAGVDPGGNLVLAGNYSLDTGYYILNYQFLQRKFNLAKGSTIAFSGSPMDADIDITAVYIANTSPADLLDNEVGTVDSKTAATFNQKIPFRVLLYLKGKMSKPDISFDIQLPDENSNVAISNELRSTIENKLVQMRSDVAVTNKEVFALLLLGRFVGEQSSDFFKSSGSGTSADEMARESVSQFLSTALNQIASDLFKGVDVDLNLNSYQNYSTGTAQQRTDLNVAVSKNFINDRLTITAGKNFDVEGQDADAETVQQNSGVLPDLTVAYKLTKDGKYLMKAYKKDQFEVLVDGYVIETGVGFMLTMDYDEFKELFGKKDKTAKPSK